MRGEGRLFYLADLNQRRKSPAGRDRVYHTSIVYSCYFLLRLSNLRPWSFEPLVHSPSLVSLAQPNAQRPPPPSQNGQRASPYTQRVSPYALPT